MLKLLNGLVKSSDQRRQAQGRASDVNQAVSGSNNIYDSLADKGKLLLQFFEYFFLWVFLNSIGLGENAEDAIQIFEHSEVAPRLRLVDKHEDAMDNQVLSGDLLLGKAHVQQTVNHYFDTSHVGAHFRFDIAKLKNAFNRHFSQLLVLRVSCDARHRLAE